MSEEISSIQTILSVLFVLSIGLAFVPLLIHQMTKPRGIDSVSNKITAVFTTTFAAISIALFAINSYYERSPLDVTGDVSNWATLVIEIGIGTAIGSAIFLYSRFQQDQSDKELRDVKAISTKLDDVMEDVKKTNDEQSDLIKEMKPIIEKQGEIIKEQEEKERIVRENLFDTIGFHLISSRNTLSQIVQFRENKDTVIFPDDLQRNINNLETSVNEITRNTNELFSLEVIIPQAIGIAKGKIHIYNTKLKNLENSEKVSLNCAPDPTEVIQQIDLALKELPKPGPA